MEFRPQHFNDQDFDFDFGSVDPNYSRLPRGAAKSTTKAVVLQR
jgi:hypothetical protein